MIAKHIIVKGKVQGVFFRKHTKQKAEELSLSGWVKNTNNDDVEIFAQGNKNEIEQLINWCWQGSPKANVENVATNDAEPDINLAGFYIHH